jgi:hypothetical protein
MTIDLENYQATFKEASDALDSGDAKHAFQTLKGILYYPGHIFLSKYWREAFGLFAEIVRVFAGDEFALKVQKVAEEADDINALYNLGYDLIESDLPEISATVLARANTITPGSPAIVSELVCALEKISFHAEACRVLREVPNLLVDNFICRYLLAFNSIMTGIFTEAQEILPTLQQQSQDATEAFMAERIAGTLQRAELLEGISTLDLQDLRGWHFVLTNALLLHISDYGLNEGMNGRYAYVQDNYSLIREGMQRLILVLNTWKISMPKVFVLPDRNSAILAHAMAKILSCPLETWSVEGNDSPGIIVVYDLGRLEPELLEQLQEHHPGQLLWSHASCWTEDMPFAADLTTYLYQFNVAPWEPGLGEQNIDDSPEACIEELAEEIVNSTLSSEALDDIDNLLKVAATVKDYRSQGGYRLKQWLGSPVPSSRFG